MEIIIVRILCNYLPTFYVFQYYDISHGDSIQLSYFSLAFRRVIYLRQSDKMPPAMLPLCF